MLAPMISSKYLSKKLLDLDEVVLCKMLKTGDKGQDLSTALFIDFGLRLISP